MRSTFTELLMEYTSTIPAAPSVASTVRSTSSSLSTIFTITRDSFSFAMSALISPGAAPNSFCAATRISGDSGSFITKVKFLPSGHVFWTPRQSFVKSASGTSDSLLPADTTTATFLMPANATAATSKKHKIAIAHNLFGNACRFMVHSQFWQFQASISSSFASWQLSISSRVSNPYACPQVLRSASPPLNPSAHLTSRAVSGPSLTALRSGTRTYPEFKFSTGVIRHGSFRSALLPAHLSCAFGFQRVAQTAAPHVETASSRVAAHTSAVAPLPQQLFGAIPLSTKSEQARKSLELAWDKYENAMYDPAANLARQAAQKDPHSALCYAMVSFAARRGMPDAAALAKAKTLLRRATPDEQLLVRWMTVIQDRNLLPAIASMNDLLKRYPRDKQILYVTGEWLFLEQDNDRARTLLENGLQVDPHFPAALNRLGYLYVDSSNPDPAKAIASLKRYAEVAPASPNPQDSLGEVLREIGDDQGSLEHYHAAFAQN